jgi:hypothetical protein
MPDSCVASMSIDASSLMPKLLRRYGSLPAWVQPRSTVRADAKPACRAKVASRSQ